MLAWRLMAACAEDNAQQGCDVEPSEQILVLTFFGASYKISTAQPDRKKQSGISYCPCTANKNKQGEVMLICLCVFCEVGRETKGVWSKVCALFQKMIG